MEIPIPSFSNSLDNFQTFYLKYFAKKKKTSADQMKT